MICPYCELDSAGNHEAGCIYQIENLVRCFGAAPENKNTGWECPKCRIIHAPSVLACYCQQGPGFVATVMS